jgi:hypothetical protein
VSSPREEYARRIDRWTGAIARGERRHFLYSNLRLAVAALIVLVLWLAFGRGALSPAWIVVPALAFGTLLVLHARLLNRLERAARARRFYLRGVDRIEGRWAGSGADGQRFADRHPLARDLDLFGRGSLFQLIDTARTEIGEETLAAWLLQPATATAVGLRQAAVRELAALVDFREDVAVLAAEADVGRTGALARWAAAPPAGISSAAFGFFLASAIATVLLAALTAAGSIEYVWVILFIVLHRAVARLWHARVARVLGSIGTPARDLALLSTLLGRIERETFTSPSLASLRGALATNGVPPSTRIGQLRRLVSWLDSDENLLFKPIAYALEWRPIFASAIDRWHASYGAAVGAWLAAIGEVEALSALATYAYEHPDDCFPDIVEPGPLFEARGLGHPLIGEAAAVRNDVAIGSAGAAPDHHPRVLIVSGSNMSGKSTLLRAVGTNVVLALAGGAVRAAAMRLSPLAIGATIRIEDSLQEGHSRFYTEILRIRAIVEQTSGRVPVLFLLDEVLHGTNSHDRRIGAGAIVRALVERGAIGLVTTHDLALTELATTMGGAAANVHFEDRIEDGRMVFDYRMRPGVVERSNALELMRAVGLDV